MLIDTPLNLRTFTVHDRLVLPPMATEKSQGEGLVSQELCDYYNDKTKSGAFGLVSIRMFLKWGKRACIRYHAQAISPFRAYRV